MPDRLPDSAVLDTRICDLSDLTVYGCHHCRIGAPHLGTIKELLGFEDDAADDNSPL